MVQGIEEDARVDRITEHEQYRPMQLRRKKRLHVGCRDAEGIERRGHERSFETQTGGLLIYPRVPASPSATSPNLVARPRKERCPIIA